MRLGYRALRADLLMLITAAIWGFAFVAQRVGMDHMGPLFFNAIRFGLGLLVLLPVFFIYQRRLLRSGVCVKSHLYPDVNGLLYAGVLAGVALFFGSSFQQIGIQYTTAGNAGFITGLYIILVPMFSMMWGKRISLSGWLGSICAIVGLFLLCITEHMRFIKGDLWVLGSAFFWAIHILVVGRWAPQYNPMLLAVVQFVVCMVLSFFAAVLFEPISSSMLSAAWLPLMYAGLLSVGIAYTLQVFAQRDAPPAHAAIILSLEAVFAVVGGWWLLAETLSRQALLGISLMLIGMLVSQLNAYLRVD